MREVVFLKQKAERWRQFETLLDTRERANPDQLAELFVELTDDLSFARTFYPESKTTQYLNALTLRVHQEIYRNRKEKRGRIVSFWKFELPFLFRKHHTVLLYSFIIFLLSALVGALSAAYDETFVRLILGDGYVDMTLDNIARGDPMGVYKQGSSLWMFFQIAWNNIMVSFKIFAAGVFLSVGTVWLLFYNGVMVGVFQFLFYQKGLLATSSLTIWLHGTIEISVIVIAGCAGLVMGEGILFPRTLTRGQSFSIAAREGVKIVIGVIPFFLIAAFIESFVTRHTEMPTAVKLAIILASLGFILWYFVFYPIQLHRSTQLHTGREHGHDADILP